MGLALGANDNEGMPEGMFDGAGLGRAVANDITLIALILR